MEVFHELGCKLRPTITNHFLGDSKLFPHVVVEKFGGSHGRDFSSGWYSYNVFGELVDNYHDRIVSL